MHIWHDSQTRSICTCWKRIYHNNTMKLVLMIMEKKNRKVHAKRIKIIPLLTTTAFINDRVCQIKNASEDGNLNKDYNWQVW